MADLKDIENKIENIEKQPEKQEETSSELNFKVIKKVIKDASRNIRYRISWDYPKILRILDKTQSIKVAEFRPKKVTFYSAHVTFKNRLLQELKRMDKFDKETKEKVIQYIEGN